VCPFNGSFFRRPASLPRVRAVSRSPASSILSGRYDFLPSVSPPFVPFGRRYHAGRLVLRFHRSKTSKPVDQEVFGCGTPHGRAPRWRRQDLPSSWGTPIARLPCSRTPAGRWLSDHYKSPAWPPLVGRRGLPPGNFRSSIAGPSDSRSPLRRRSHPLTTPDSLPGAGQALPGGLGYPQGSDERFPKCTYISSPFPKLRLARPTY